MTRLISIILESNFIQGILIFPDSASSIGLLAFEFTEAGKCYGLEDSKI